jgi:hypothetical protein
VRQPVNVFRQHCWLGHEGRRRGVIDRLVPNALRKVAVVLHLSSSREQDTGDLESQALHRQGLGHEMKRVLWGTKRTHAGGRAAPFFLIGAVVTDGGGPTGLEDGWTAGEARRGKRSRAGQEGGKRNEGAGGKSGGGRASIYT